MPGMTRYRAGKCGRRKNSVGKEFIFLNSPDKGLIRAPPVQVVEEHTGDDQRPRNLRLRCVPCVDCVHLGRISLDHVLYAVENAVTAGCCGQSREAEERNHQTADDQADAVDGIRNCNGLQTAEDRVAAAS